MKHILVVDNYDSFTYNLVHYLEALECRVSVYRNDTVPPELLKAAMGIVLSPGPGIPDEAGQLKHIIRTFAGKKPILGVCLGQQAIAEVFGGKLLNLNTVYHGVAGTIHRCVNDETLFLNMPEYFKVGRYHSWVVHPDLPESLEATSYDEHGYIMSLRHKTLPVKGVQFHPESILTPHGKLLLKNWLDCDVR